VIYPLKFASNRDMIFGKDPFSPRLCGLFPRSLAISIAFISQRKSWVPKMAYTAVVLSVEWLTDLTVQTVFWKIGARDCPTAASGTWTAAAAQRATVEAEYAEKISAEVIPSLRYK
jgi:hypothetical protein